jgi:peroxiredoxin
MDDACHHADVCQIHRMRAHLLLLAGSMLLAPAAGCTTPRAEGSPVPAPAPAPATIPPISGEGGGRGDDGKPFDNDVSDIVGHPAKPWTVDAWLNSAPLTLDGLHGKVVFVRWFMGSSCPMCSATAPSLNQLHEHYGARGLAVVGMYHHKDDEPMTRELVQGYVDHFGFHFPVAIDDGWRTAKSWWLTGHEHRKFTSVSFLIDKKGVVRHVHLGGRLAPTDGAFKAMETYIETLLAEPD